MKDVAWKYCTLQKDEEKSKVQCNLCKGFVSLGGNRKTQSSTLFNRHLQRHHFKLYSELNKEPLEEKSRDDESSSKKSTIF